MQTAGNKSHLRLYRMEGASQVVQLYFQEWELGYSGKAAD